MPEGAGVHQFYRPGVAGALAGQLVFGVIVGIAVQLLFVYVIVYGLPHLGVDLFNAVGRIAQYDAPGKIIEWIEGL